MISAFFELLNGVFGCRTDTNNQKEKVNETAMGFLWLDDQKVGLDLGETALGRGSFSLKCGKESESLVYREVFEASGRDLFLFEVNDGFNGWAGTVDAAKGDVIVLVGTIFETEALGVPLPSLLRSQVQMIPTVERPPCFLSLCFLSDSHDGGEALSEKCRSLIWFLESIDREWAEMDVEPMIDD
eukprot:scaffold32283_cov54-Attheya_sp.AAC.1